MGLHSEVSKENLIKPQRVEGILIPRQDQKEDISLEKQSVPVDTEFSLGLSVFPFSFNQ